MANPSEPSRVNEYLADVYERLRLQQKALIELLYDVAALKSLLSPEQVAQFEASKQSQVHDLANAVSAEQGLHVIDALIARIRGH